MLHLSSIPTLSSFYQNKTLNSHSVSSSQNPPLYLKFHPSHLQNLQYLKNLNIINNPSSKIPKNPSPQTISNVLSTVNFLKSKGFSDPDFARLSFLCPNLFSPYSTPTLIQLVFDFLTSDLAASPKDSLSLILRCPKILEANVEFHLRPTLNYLRRLGLRNLSSPTTLNAHLLNTRVENLEEKVRFLQKNGFSEEESSRVCARFPSIFGYSIENNLRPKLEFLVKEMKMGVEELKGFPQYFAFSLEKRIVPRHLHLKQRGVRIPLNRMLLWSDHRFYTKFK